MLPNNTTLLINQEYYDPHTIVVNATKLKYYYTNKSDIATA